MEAGLNVSINTPLCSLNQDYTATLALANSLGVRYATCSGLIPTGGAETDPSKATRLTPEALTAVLRPAMAYAEQNHIEINFTSPGWLPDAVLLTLALPRCPAAGPAFPTWPLRRTAPFCPARAGCGRALAWATSCMTLAQDLECPRLPPCAEESAKMEHICQLGTTVPAQGGL